MHPKVHSGTSIEQPKNKCRSNLFYYNQAHGPQSERVAIDSDVRVEVPEPSVDDSYMCGQGQEEDGNTRVQEPLVNQVFDQEDSIIDELSTVKDLTRRKSKKHNVPQATSPSDPEDEIPRLPCR